ncbi:ABC transporter ATP-binding protein [Ignatzschineria rhizosphaerae]|uniref:ABC transporter ATP-binding protein n=1 Tax=Ignatzschineria rhizosphaerae TaxID=2923279 RepID=A0ABY3X2D9_9GAMM|nr:ABC transporter ATP-binding protein [Ignatzschineria rhizosphaerae]UNM97048.1 ABC transporter ATP-binding protein [Ignatzschineria rhizosphaerae]
MMRLEDIQVIFNEHTPLENMALKKIDLTIREGEFVTVIGTNGAGKSTLLNVISGNAETTAGKVFINNEDVTFKSVSDRARLVARVFQDPMVGTCESLTIEENLALAYDRGNKESGLKPAVNKERREIFKEHLSTLKLGLENRLEDSMGLLSGGQRQAISLLMSSLQPSKILLLDEHTAALDPKTAAFVLKLTEEIVSKNKLTTLMVTHSMQQALSYGNRTIMLHQGEIVLDVSGEMRENLSISDLLVLFEQSRGDKVEDDALLLG